MTPSHYPDRAGYKARQTSRDAAAGISPRARPMRERILTALQSLGPSTPEELAAHLSETVANVRPRCSEASAKGLISDTGVRRRAQGGRMAIVWTLTEQANAK